MGSGGVGGWGDSDLCDGRRGGALGTDRKVCSDAKRCHRGQALRHTTRRGGGSLGQHTTKTISLDSRPGKITTRANLNYNKIIPPIDIRCNFAPQYPALPQRGNFYRPNGILQISFFLLCNFVVAIVGLRVEESRLYSSQYTRVLCHNVAVWRNDKTHHPSSRQQTISRGGSFPQIRRKRWRYGCGAATGAPSQ